MSCTEARHAAARPPTGPAPGADASGPGWDPRLKKLLSICKHARIFNRIGPNNFKDAAKVEAVMARYGLTIDSGKKEIKAVRKRVEEEKELDGIDAGNILEAPVGSRRGRALAPCNAAANPYLKAEAKPAPAAAAPAGEASKENAPAPKRRAAVICDSDDDDF